MKTIEVTPVAIGNCNTAEFNFAIKTKQQAVMIAKHLKSLGINASNYEQLERDVTAAGICIWADDTFVNEIIKELSKWTHLLYFLFEKIS